MKKFCVVAVSLFLLTTGQSICSAQSAAYAVKIRFGVLDTTCYPDCSHPSEWRQRLYADIYDSVGNPIPPSTSIYYNWAVDFCRGFNLLFGWAEGYGLNFLAPDGNKIKSEPGCCDVCSFQAYYVAVKVTIEDETLVSQSILIPNIEVPTKFDLRQNYPNPFNGSTLIQYSIFEQANVRLRVQDALGRTVATLVDKYLPAGVYSARWSPINATSGVYFCQLVVKRAYKKTITKSIRMIIEK